MRIGEYRLIYLDSEVIYTGSLYKAMGSVNVNWDNNKHDFLTKDLRLFSYRYGRQQDSNGGYQ